MTKEELWKLSELLHLYYAEETADMTDRQAYPIYTLAENIAFRADERE